MKDNNLKALENLKKILEKKDNIYEVSVVVAKRAKQIQEHRRELFYNELDSIGVNNHEEMTPNALNKENWREAVYEKYDSQPRPLVKSLEEIAEDKVSYHYKKSSDQDAPLF